MKLLSILSIIAVLELAYGGTVHIFDQEDQPVNSIVQQVCWHKAGTSKQISKISTIRQIAKYLVSFPTDNKFANCSEIYLGSVKELENVLSISNDNVCSEQKISAIQQFHRNYVLKGSRRDGKIPKVLATFFYHYVNSISKTCATETVGFFEALISSPMDDGAEVDKLLAEITGETGVSSSTNLDYSDMFLVWTIVDMLPLHQQHKIEKYIFEGSKRVVLSLKNAESFKKMQEFCSTKAKPLYSHSLLSTIKLIVMGYYPSDSTILEQLNDKNRRARRFYEITKICETLLPVHVIERPGQSDSDAVFLSHDEVANLGLSLKEQHDPEVQVEICMRCSMVDLDSLPTINTVDAVSIAKRVTSDIKSRKSAISGLLKMFVKTTKSSIFSNLKRLFCGEAPEEIDESVDESQLDIYDVSVDDESDNAMMKSNQPAKGIIGSMAVGIPFVFSIMFVVVWALVTNLILRPFAALFYLFEKCTSLGNDRLFKFLCNEGTK